jgi:peptidoglycan hydrolase-like protein with peptidoglycan-binding domain
MAKRNKKSAMTASILSQLPLAAGSALLGTVNRGGIWVVSRYMKAPLASTGLLAMVTLTALAGSNALYFQTEVHPSPFFAPARGSIATVTAPAEEQAEQRTISEPAADPAPAPLAGPAALPQVASTDTTGSVPVTVPDAPVGNAQMFEVQKKLFELQLFTGQVDGYYGPRTAAAIRAFEQMNGMELTGSTDARVLDAILSSDAAGRVPAAPQPQAEAAPAPAPVVVQQAAMATPSAPVVPAAPQADQLVARLPALSPAEQVFDDVAQTAANTIDGIIAAVDVPRSPPQATANPPIPSANVTVAARQPLPEPLTPTVAPVAPAPAPAAPVQQAGTSTPAATVAPASDAQLVTQIQRGLASLGFYRAPVDGRPSAETARAIREFESFNNFEMTGQVKPDLVPLLLRSGATI